MSPDEQSSWPARRRWPTRSASPRPTPPRDNARTVALYAILLTIVAGLVVPLGVVYVTTRL